MEVIDATSCSMHPDISIIKILFNPIIDDIKKAENNNYVILVPISFEKYVNLNYQVRISLLQEEFNTKSPNVIFVMVPDDFLEKEKKESLKRLMLWWYNSINYGWVSPAGFDKGIRSAFNE